MSDTERLEAAAAELEQRAARNEALTQGRPEWRLDGRAADDRAVAALLRSLAQFEEEEFLPGVLLMPALAVADAVLGVPASPKEQTP